MLPAIKWGAKHEENAKKPLFSADVSKHKHGKLLDSVLITNGSYAFILATPDNLFSCQCCEGPVPVEYMCLFKMWEKGQRDWIFIH